MDYPFAALVGQEPLKTALLLTAVHPGIGGVLIRGEKGTAKSTAARGLAALLPPVAVVTGCPFHCDPAAPWNECPHCTAAGERAGISLPVPFVELPLGATEDRVLGTLDFERALREGRRAFQPGLLAAAHRGILYIDEVNLLADHLVDVLLDAAASGVNTVQREGMSVTHPARFLLVGTMNPEEGELRPQLLDRFGLMVQVTGPREPDVRAEVVRRRLAFDRDPAAFAQQWAAEQQTLSERISAARKRLDTVTLSDELLGFLTRLCCEVEVDGLRADIVLHKAACALAALEGRAAVNVEDIRRAAELVLPHRQRRRPFQQPQMDPQRLQEACERAESPNSDNSQGVDTPRSPESEQTFTPQSQEGRRAIEVVPAGGSPRPGNGRRNPAGRQAQGQYVRAVPDPETRDVALDATLRAAVLRHAGNEGALTVQQSDLHRKERSGRVGTLILFVVDSSGSMAARRRMELVKGAVLGLLQDAYEQRDQVGVIAFRGTRAELLLGPTSSVELAEQALHQLPTGGRTPLAHALVLARETVERVRRTQPDLLVLVVLLSDGKANVGLETVEAEPWAQAAQAAGLLAAEGVATLVLDSEAGLIRKERAEELARLLGAQYLPLEQLSAEDLVLQIQQRRPAGRGPAHA
jgi:magnesium chelatase subunit D